MDWEWLLAAVIVAVPVVLFGIIEFLAYRRRRRDKRLAQRPKRRNGAGSTQANSKRQAS